MPRLRPAPVARIAAHPAKVVAGSRTPQPAVSAVRVKQTLLGLNFVLHATRVVGHVEAASVE